MSEPYGAPDVPRLHQVYRRAGDLIAAHVQTGSVADLILEPVDDDREAEASRRGTAAPTRPAPAILSSQENGLRVEAVTIGDPAVPPVALDGLDAMDGVRVFCLLEGFDRLGRPDIILRMLAERARARPSPLLVLSVPNVGHVDTARQLLAGRWGVERHDTPTTPRSFFTRRRLVALLAAHGWSLVAESNVEDHATRQADLQTDEGSLLAQPTLAGDHLRYLARLFNRDADVRRFVWLLRQGPAEADTAEAPVGRPLVSILIRTQGHRNERLTEALYSVFAQTCDDYEVLVCFHNLRDSTGRLYRGVRDTIDRLPESLRAKIRTIECHLEGRGSPLNEMLDRAYGRYASFLDDDDLLFEHHVETLRRGIEQHGVGPLFQTYAAQRVVDGVAHATPSGGTPTSLFPYTTHSMSVRWTTTFDHVDEHHQNLVPICCMAVPIALVRQSGLRFRSDLEVGEDWDFWMGASEILAIVTLPELTAMVNHWNDDFSNAMRSKAVAQQWHQVRDGRHVDHRDVPLLLPGAVRQALRDLGRNMEESAWLRSALTAERGRAAALEKRLAIATSEIRSRDQRLASIYRSRFWRVATQVWRVHGVVRGMFRR